MGWKAGTPYKWPVKGDSIQKGYLFQASGVWNMVGISLVEGYKRVWQSVVSVCKNDLKHLQKDFMAVKKQIKFFGFVIYSLYFIRKCIYS